MIHDTLTCDHPQCHGLTNFLTQDEQLRVAWENGDKIRVALIGLEALAEKQRERIIIYTYSALLAIIGWMQQMTRYLSNRVKITTFC